MATTDAAEAKVSEAGETEAKVSECISEEILMSPRTKEAALRGGGTIKEEKATFSSEPWVYLFHHYDCDTYKRIDPGCGR